MGKIWNSVPENNTIFGTIIIGFDCGDGIGGENDRATINACRVEGSVYRFWERNESRITSVQVTWIVEKAGAKSNVERKGWSRCSRRI